MTWAGVAGVPSPGWAQWSGSIRATLGPEFDSNAPRAVENNLATSQAPPLADGLVRLAADAAGSWNPRGPFRLDGNLLLGAKRFFGRTVLIRPEDGSEPQTFDTRSQDLLTYDGSLDAQILTRRLQLSALGGLRVSRLREGSRDYSVFRGLAQVQYSVTSSVAVGFRAGGSVFDYPPDRQFDFSSPQVGVFASWQASRKMLLSLEFDGRYRGFRGPGGDVVLIRDIDADGDMVPPVRQDLDGQVGASVWWRSPALQWSVSYRLQVQRSLSQATIPNPEFDPDDPESEAPEFITSGGSVEFDRHRVSASVTVRAPLRFLVTALGTLQFNLGQVDQLADLAEADENQNSVQLQLRRPLSPVVSVDVRYAFFASQFQEGVAGTDFQRHTVFAGLTAYLRGGR